MRNFLTVAAALTLVWSPAANHALGGSAAITIDVDKPGVKVSPRLYGVFFEEINRSGDGGIYAEMVQNRSFEDAPTPNAWTLLNEGGGTMALDKSRPLNANNPTALKLEITSTASGRVGVVNQGFKGARWNKKWGLSPFNTEQPVGDYAALFAEAAKKSTSGIAVEKGKEYRLSLYARCGDGGAVPLAVSIEKLNGTVLASGKVTGLASDWKKFQIPLIASDTDSNARLVISASAPGTVYLDMVSLFPTETFKGRENGIREDLGRMIAAMKPAFLRFPGGCYVEGDFMADAFRWKKTIGDIAERPGHWCRWGYYCTYGLGYHEYLQFCEDIGAEPLFVINCGMSHKEHVPLEQLDEFVQDALDAIEYANGPVESRWGALRAKAGHPAPFNLKLIQIGNENGGKPYDERYARFYDAIKASHPGVKIVANFWRGIPESRPIELLDEHYYNTPEFFMREARRYDSYDRGSGYRIYCGEYAVTQQCGMGNHIAALGEAAFMTGLERNSDIVEMSSYAPLLVHPEWRAWNPNAIVFDSSRAYGTPSYHAQAMFANHRADVLVGTTVESPVVVPPVKEGMIGVALKSGQAEFREIRVSQGGKPVYEWDPARGLAEWKTQDGRWEIRNGALCQTGTADFSHALLNRPVGAIYTLTLKARKIDGPEGFMVLFQNQLEQNSWERTCWNLGGWYNTKHVLQGADMGDERVDGQIETGRWYEIRLEVNPGGVTCWLDGRPLQKLEYRRIDSLYATAGLNAAGDELILKVVNVSGSALKTPITLRGVKQLAPTGSALVMAGHPTDENSFETPAKVTPKPEVLTGVSPEFTHTFPAHSISVLRLKIQN